MAGDILGKMHVKLRFEAVYREHWRKIYNYIYGRLLSAADAEEVTADVFIAAWENWEKYDASRAKITTWLGTIAHNKVNDYFRKAYRRKELSVAEFPEPMQPTQAARTEGSFDDPASERTYEILQQLTEDERNLLEMRYTLDMDNDEVAAVLGASANAVSHRYRRLLDKCRKISEKIFS